MFRRLMIGLLVVGLVMIFLAEAANAIDTSRRRRSVGFYFEYEILSGDTEDGHWFTTGVYGLSAEKNGCDTGCGEVKGDLYCAPPPEEGDESGANITACQAATGGSAALVAVLDPDAFPAFFTPDDYNFSVKEFGQRLELSYFTEHEGETISLPVGTKKTDAGWHFITDPVFSLPDYVGTVVGWDADLGKFIPSDGYGINGEQFISSVSLVTKWDDQLDIVDERLICAVWRHDQIKWQGDSLKGNYYGLAAFYATYNEATNTVDALIMDVYDVCGGLLYNDVEAGAAENTYVCGEQQEVVFAPAPYVQGDDTLEVDAFREKAGQIICDDDAYPYSCRGSAEIELNPVKGQELCNKYYTNYTYVDFIPINNDCGTYAFTGYAQYYGNCIPGTDGCSGQNHSSINDTVKCSEGGDSKFLLYDCEPVAPEVLPTCVGLGQAPWKVDDVVLTCPEPE